MVATLIPSQGKKKVVPMGEEEEVDVRKWKKQQREGQIQLEREGKGMVRHRLERNVVVKVASVKDTAI